MPQTTYMGQKLFVPNRRDRGKSSSSAKGTLPRDIRFFNKTRQDMQFVGPADYNICDTDTQNSKIRGPLCNAVFGRKPMNVDARENAGEYIMVGQNIKHAPAYKNVPTGKQSLRKRAHDVNDLGSGVTVKDIFFANVDNLSEMKAADGQGV